ncbi:MAG: DUF4261 domain-containing protein [Deltaproteobacteria bacterium]|nr:DUF4261 domain-containing protein [Deltaproteobacteria bacterium]
MPKGFFTQGIAVLLREPLSLAEVRKLVEPKFDIVKETAATGGWEMGGPSLVVSFRPEVNGYATIDVVTRPWPDHMGDPKQEPTLFAAWSMGNFGPFAFPNGLTRSVQQAWTWDGASDAVAAHRAFARIRLTYLAGAADDAPVMPADCDPFAELRFATGLALAVLDHPSTICLFNPNGEVLMSAAGVRGALESAEEHGYPPLDAWVNVRLSRLGDDWLVMDTVGSRQIELRDLEAAFPAKLADANEVGPFLRNVALHLVENGLVIQHGHTVDGPGGVWRALWLDDGLLSPPRDVLRLLPVAAKNVPPALDPAHKPDRPWWKLW